jgi:hypothetical protein
VQLQDWLDRGGDGGEVSALIGRMQQHFVRAFVRDTAQRLPARIEQPSKRASG